jgi:pimeloyl-ACP methyl ester carboxylesterase
VLTATLHGEGRPIVMLPGFGLDGAVMAAACEPAFAQLPAGQDGHAGQRWRRIYLDLPGTGASPAGKPTADAVLAAVQDTIAELVGDAPYRLVGHSFGGYLAAGLARRKPDRMTGLFLICCGARIRPADRDLSGVLPSAPEPGWLDGVPEDLREHFGHGIGHQTRAVADRVTAAFDLRAPVDDEYLAALRPEGYRLPDEDEASATEFTGPVALLAGRRDRIAGYRDPFAALARYPGGSYTVLADAGHYLPFEQPERFAAHILDWLTQIG